MIYNPIFEEEKERKIQLKELKKEIQKRARKESINKIIMRVFNLLQKGPSSISSLFNQTTELVKTTKTKEV